MKTNRVITIVGPTASGKSAVALKLAKIIGGEIVNADSRQIYQTLHYGTSQPSSDDKKIVTHHLYDFLKPDQIYSAGQYAKEASQTIKDIFKRKGVPIVVGGTGLYLRSLFDGISELPGRDDAIRKNLQTLADEKGRKFLHEKLRSIDPISADKIPFQNIQRVIRALEVYQLTGNPLSELHKKSSKTLTSFHPIFFGLLWEKEKLKEHILERTKRIAPQLIEETKEILKKGFKETDPGLQSLGYREAVRLLNGEISSETFFNSLLKDTLQYAKRQMTWFKKDSRVKWIKVQETFHPENIADQLKEELKSEV